VLRDRGKGFGGLIDLFGDIFLRMRDERRLAIAMLLMGLEATTISWGPLEREPLL